MGRTGQPMSTDQTSLIREAAAVTLNTTHGGTETPRNLWDPYLCASVPRCVVIVNSSELDTPATRRPEKEIE